MLRVYGLKNCDSCRNARRHLDKNDIQYQFIDLRDSVPQPGQVRAWLAILGEERLLNRRSTSWRGLPEQFKLPLGQLSEQHLIALICEHPTLVKRPLFVNGAHMLTGFKADVLDDWLAADEEQ